MNLGNDTPPPAPLVLADMLAMHAWNPHLDQATKQLCGWAADSLRQVCRHNAKLSHDRDQAEADAEHLFALHYGAQRGGAA